MPTDQELIDEYDRYFNYYRNQRLECGVPSVYEAYWMGHIAGLLRRTGQKVDPKFTEWLNDPCMTRYHSPENTYQRIVEEISLCRNCELHQHRNKTVPGDGPLRATLMVVAEAPGADEDAAGICLVGKAGVELFQELFLKLKGWARERMFVANTLKCRPPGNRDPKPEEVRACHHFLHRQIMLVGPKVIIAAGKYAGAWFTGQDAWSQKTTLKGMMGKVHWYQHIPVLVMPHPAGWLRQKNTDKDKRKPYDMGPYIWDALNKVEQIINTPFSSEFWSK